MNAPLQIREDVGVVAVDHVTTVCVGDFVIASADNLFWAHSSGAVLISMFLPSSRHLDLGAILRGAHLRPEGIRLSEDSKQDISTGTAPARRLLKLAAFEVNRCCHTVREIHQLQSSQLRASRGLENGVEDLAVAGAAADIPAQRGLDLIEAGIGALVEQLRAGHQHARDAVAALHRSVGDEGLLEWV